MAKLHPIHRRGLSIVLALASAAGFACTPPARAADCAPEAPGQPMFVTENCDDPYYRASHAVVLVDVMRPTPVPHRFVEGTFLDANGATFAFYFPPAQQFQGRFFQGPVHQLRLTGEVASDQEISFAIASGGYLVEVNAAGDNMITPRHCMDGRVDLTRRGYRLNAAAAKFSRTVARQIYGDAIERPYGYLWGGSGGAYMTMSAAEYSEGVWDGFVPFVMGHPHAIPNNATIMANALRVLKERPEVLPMIADALDVGGSGDPYAGLTVDEAAAFREATRLGFPLQGWIRYGALNTALLDIIGEYVPIIDPAYAADFWSQPGYLGTEQSSAGQRIRAARIQFPATVLAATPLPPQPPYEQMGPAYLAFGLSQVLVGPPGRVTLSGLPEGDLAGIDLVFLTGANAGKRINLASPDRLNNTVGFGPGADWDVAAAIRPGDMVLVDNSMSLARETIHRHQDVDNSFLGWQQFDDPKYARRRDSDGQSILIGTRANVGATGAVATGRFHGKMILAQSLWDTDAFIWGGEWYRRQAIEKRGADYVAQNFRIWLQDHARHDPGAISGQEGAFHASFYGVLEQALRDVAAWAEQGIEPPSSTRFAIDDQTQVRVPAAAAERGGIQPVVDLKVNDGAKAVVAVDETVTLTATIAVPPGTGRIVKLELDTLGYGNFVEIPVTAGQESMTLSFTLAYPSSGTFFPVLRATSQREGDAATSFARPMNLGRARVVVGDGIGGPNGGPAPPTQTCPLPNQAPNGSDVCVPVTDPLASGAPQNPPATMAPGSASGSGDSGRFGGAISPLLLVWLIALVAVGLRSSHRQIRRQRQESGIVELLRNS
jgi:hypothetical protein